MIIIIKVGIVIRLDGFPPTTPGNDEQNKYRIVILGLDPGIQGFFNINTKDIKFFE